MIIRKFEESDLHRCIVLGSMMHKESPEFKDVNFSATKCVTLGLEVISNPKRMFGYLAEDNDGKILGFMMGEITEYYFGYDLIASDLLLFVTKSRRGCMAAVNLIKKYEQWAQEHGADEIQLGSTTGINDERTNRLYEKLGYKTKGIVFKKESDDVRRRK